MSEPREIHPCRALYEPWVAYEDRAGTHSCCKLAGHEGPHICPDCQTVWAAPRTLERVDR